MLSSALTQARTTDGEPPTKMENHTRKKMITICHNRLAHFFPITCRTPSIMPICAPEMAIIWERLRF